MSTVEDLLVWFLTVLKNADLIGYLLGKIRTNRVDRKSVV